MTKCRATPVLSALELCRDNPRKETTRSLALNTSNHSFPASEPTASTKISVITSTPCPRRSGHDSPTGGTPPPTQAPSTMLTPQQILFSSEAFTSHSTPPNPINYPHAQQLLHPNYKPQSPQPLTSNPGARYTLTGSTLKPSGNTLLTLTTPTPPLPHLRERESRRSLFPPAGGMSVQTNTVQTSRKTVRGTRGDSIGDLHRGVSQCTGYL